MEREELRHMKRIALEEMVLDQQEEIKYLKERIDCVLKGVFPKKLEK